MYGLVLYKYSMLNFFSLLFYFDLMSDIFQKLCSADAWEEFYFHKSKKEPESGRFLTDLRRFIDERAYLAHAESLRSGIPFPSPAKKLISKGHTAKKRVVFTFPFEETLILKFLARELKRYDHLFSPNLYSFRSSRSVRDAWEHLARIKNKEQKYVYKVDISDYFRSVEPSLILPLLKTVLAEEEALYRILEQLLLDPYAVTGGEKHAEKKGVLPGVPVSAFLANLFLAQLDRHFFEKRVEYLRYSDDIILLADSKEELARHAAKVKEALREKGLEINSKKEVWTDPGEPWEFLGFTYFEGEVDVSQVAYEKLRGKMRRKTRALKRWADKKGLHGNNAAKAFIRRFREKMFENPVAGDLTWARWYFPVITTDKTLKRIDAYACDCIRYLATGTRTKRRFDLRYDDIKALGYENLVNAYHRFREGKFSPDE